jgi:hypothetical protein
MNFDKYERFAHMRNTLDALSIPPDAPLLDVGGHPGELAGALAPWRVTTVDRPPTGNAPYVRASGTALPFRDNSFAAVLSSDTLEHIPPGAREAFLAESWRVASEFVLVAAPFATPGVALAESLFLSIESAARAAANPWLAEHARFGLPDLAATWRFFEERGGAAAAIPGGDLVRWFLLYSAEPVLEDLPGAGDTLARFMPDYNRHFAHDPIGAAPYRHMLIVSKRGQLPEALRRGPHVGRIPDISKDDSAIRPRIEAIHRALAEIAAAVGSLKARGDVSGSAENAYVESVEKVMILQERRIRELEQQLAEARQGGIARRIARRLRRLAGG